MGGCTFKKTGNFCINCCNAGYRQDIWMVTVRGDCEKYDQDEYKIEQVEKQLQSINPDVSFTTVKTRRRLSPGEQYLHRLRQAKPYRDSPVLTRLLKEIREANRQ